MPERIIPGTGVLLIEDEGVKILVLADLHLNDEDEIFVQETVKDLRKLSKDYKTDLIIINGDVFDYGTGGVNVETLINEITSFSNLVIIEGNHDQEIFPPFYLTKNYCVMHGDYDYNTGKKFIILGHTHPLLKNKRVFLKGDLKDSRKFILLPSYKEEIHGADLEERTLTLGFIFTKNMIKKGVICDLNGKKLAELKY